MSASFRSFTVSRLAPVIGALWLCAGGPAWAGSGGGEDAPGVQQVLDAICPQIGTPLSSCPQLPTAAQIAANIAGLINQQIDDVRNTQTVFVSSTPCGRAFIDTGVPCTQVAINAANPMVISPPDGPLANSQASLLAFLPGAQVTQYDDPAAKRFLYAGVIAGSNGQPEVLDIILDDTSNTDKQFSKGTQITFKLPLVILNTATFSETPVTASLTLTATCNGAANCLTGTVTGVVNGKSPPSAGQFGIQFSSNFVGYRQWEVQIPIVATPKNDGAYFSNSVSLPCPNGNAANAFSGYCNAFSQPALGYTASVLGPGLSIGIAPYAAPLCPNNTCPTTPPKTNYFGFCASGANGPVAATFIHIGTDGTTIVTTPVSTTNLQCPS